MGFTLVELDAQLWDLAGYQDLQHPLLAITTVRMILGLEFSQTQGPDIPGESHCFIERTIFFLQIWKAATQD